MNTRELKQKSSTYKQAKSAWRYGGGAFWWLEGADNPLDMAASEGTFSRLTTTILPAASTVPKHPMHIALGGSQLTMMQGS